MIMKITQKVIHYLPTWLALLLFPPIPIFFRLIFPLKLLDNFKSEREEKEGTKVTKMINHVGNIEQ